jgi:hypothetical protein
MSIDRFYGLTGNLGVKAPVKTATSTNITLSGLQTINGVTLSVGDATTPPDRVLVKNQTNAVENGIWIVSSATWTRSPDFDGEKDVVTGTLVAVSNGSYQGQIFMVSSDDNPILPGTSEMTFVEQDAAQFLQATDYGVVMNGSTDDTAALVAAIEASSESNKTLIIPNTGAGIVYLNSAFTQISGKDNIRVICEPGVRFLDAGRLITGANAASKRIPWGFEFYQCDNLEWYGGQWETPDGDTALDGSSSGFFSAAGASIYTNRRPVFSINDCDGVKITGLKLSGNPGVGCAGADRDIIIAANPSLGDTALKFAYFTLRGAFFNVYNSSRVDITDIELVADKCAREQITLLGVDKFTITRPTSLSTGTNFASMMKIINCSNGLISNIRCTDTSTASLFDVIGKYITIRDSHVDYPNGKFCDISHEWEAGNAPSDYITIEDCSTTAVEGIINVQGGSTNTEVTDNPITNVLIRRFKINSAGTKTDFTTDPYLVRLPGVISYTVEDCEMTNVSTCGFTHTNNGGTGQVRFVNCKYRWTQSSANVDSNARAFSSAVVVELINCDIDADSTGSGVTSINIGGTSGADMYFTNCVINDTNFAGGSSVDCFFVGCRMTSVTFSISPTTYSIVNSIVDGVLTVADNVAPGVLRLQRNDTVGTATEALGSLQFYGNDASSSASGTRAKLEARYEGTTGQTGLYLSTTAGASTSLVDAVVADGEQEVFFPGITTTASAANAFIDNGSTPVNQLKRSTSSIRYKDDVQDLAPSAADAIMKMRPVRYRSKAKGDNKDWTFYGLIAEELAELDPRLVHYSYPVVGKQTVEKEITLDNGKKELRMVEEFIYGDELIPDGVQYERLTVLLINIVQRLRVELDELKAKGS